MASLLDLLLNRTITLDKISPFKLGVDLIRPEIKVELLPQKEMQEIDYTEISHDEVKQIGVHLKEVNEIQSVLSF